MTLITSTEFSFDTPFACQVGRFFFGSSQKTVETWRTIA
ncbi:hypothetical protein BURPS1106B_A3644 [Burkholderia pseudomallei 1106b]|uniref:Uncharacterized protein n=1 Tax=Burkholderia pseudomallei (strain 1106a) TaxID=357348 RepID=A3NQM4_BURP0|nr:hypothetical protein BURPS1106A_0362 [Burkholderia pseudomallei 1106a]EES24186.1 hypothetical protein BURPS1106B_A3644 [Burkholderia pseudomallei 1106b]